jgi:hypothetical protein
MKMMDALTIQDFDKAEQERKTIYLKVFPWDINYKKRMAAELKEGLDNKLRQKRG